MKKSALLLIDIQNDFCLPERRIKVTNDPKDDIVFPQGALYVKGAENDVKRIVDFIDRNKSQINYIGLTQDTHQVIDISHPSYWQDKDGNNPGHFTSISSSQIRSGEWTPRYMPHESLKYVEELERQKEFPHCIWPEHCIVGSTGAAIVDELMTAVKNWARQGRFFQVIQKGEHPLSEHFGAFRANIPVQNAPATQLNQYLINTLEKYNEIYFAGEASSHCVANTLKQAMEFPQLASKFIILEDGMSPVPGFETLADPIYAQARQMGIRFAKLTDINL